jgi:hypothetical protein
LFTLRVAYIGYRARRVVAKNLPTTAAVAADSSYVVANTADSVTLNATKQPANTGAKYA